MSFGHVQFLLIDFNSEEVKMGLGERATDWQVCGVAQIAAGEAVAAGIYVFDFYSATANITGRFRLSGAGIGLGGNASGTLVPAEIGPFGPWSSIACDEAFSLSDLNNCWGRLSTLSVGMGLLFGVVYITAAPRFWSTRTYFHSQNVGGFGTGAGAGGIVIIGGWHFSNISRNQPGAATSNPSTMA